ncbi:hypothetical protein XthCFBP4691_19030 [Xanthomonas theicola]|uniref:Uncharacterized protein n=2 Tax=Xanthomonas theicola TaxID=56464 RepID=A0A2S6ZAE4_9XANT|nr:hypothetical protein XthCFBP4691_19030 [Xanthomonas theicola]
MTMFGIMLAAGCGHGDGQTLAPAESRSTGVPVAAAAGELASGAPAPRHTADELRRLAEHLLECATLAENALNAPAMGITTTDVAALETPEAKHRRQRCGRLGPGARVEALRLLHQAAAQGDGDAKVILLDQQTGALLDTLAARVDGDGRVEMTLAEREQFKQIVLGLEQQAYRGNRRAMSSLQQAMDSSVLEMSEPSYSAAWGLVVQQPMGRPMPSGPLLGEAALDDLDADKKQQIVTMARDLHALCCVR